MERVSDEALLAGMAAGDADAAAAIVRRHQSRVYGLALSVVGDAQVAEEVAQEAFVRAWRHADAFDARRGAVTTWLLSITRNHAIDRVRARRVRPEGPLEEVLDSLAASDPEPADRSAHADDVRRTMAAVAALPEGQRRALLLATYGGWTAAEVAAAEGIPLGTAKTRIRSGLARVRAVVVEEVQP